MASNLARIEDRYTAEPNTGCWLWTGAMSSCGYGVIKDAGRDWLVHRFIYRAYYGPIPDGLVIDHLCNTPTCINPEHLRACTQKANVLRSRGLAAINATKTHCLRGHEFTPQNTKVSKAGHRACRKCVAATQRLYMIRKDEQRYV